MGLPAVTARTNFAAVSPNTSCRRRDTWSFRFKEGIDATDAEVRTFARDWQVQSDSERCAGGTGKDSGESGWSP